jgi:hypothetical protein
MVKAPSAAGKIARNAAPSVHQDKRAMTLVARMDLWSGRRGDRRSDRPGIMLAASQLVRTDGRMRRDLVLRAVSPGMQRWMEVLNCVAALAFCAGRAWYGWSIVAASWQIDELSSSDLQFPMWLYSAAVPAGALPMTGRDLARHETPESKRTLFLARLAFIVGNPVGDRDQVAQAIAAARGDL